MDVFVANVHGGEYVAIACLMLKCVKNCCYCPTAKHASHTLLKVANMQTNKAYIAYNRASNGADNTYTKP